MFKSEISLSGVLDFQVFLFQKIIINDLLLYFLLLKIMKRKLRLPRIVKPFETKEKIILRDYLALERTTLANERTLFSYIRTSLYLVIGGIGLLKLEDFRSLRWLGYVALVISGILIIYGMVRYFMLKHKLHKFYEKSDLPE